MSQFLNMESKTDFDLQVSILHRHRGREEMDCIEGVNIGEGVGGVGRLGALGDVSSFTLIDSDDGVDCPRR